MISAIPPVKRFFVASGFRKISDGIRRNVGDLLWLRDMQKVDFEFVSKALGHGYMENITTTPTFPVQGMIFSDKNGRRCVCLTVQRAKKMIWVPFVIHGGSPVVHLGEDCMKALDIKESELFAEVNVNIHGFNSITACHDGSDNSITP